MIKTLPEFSTIILLSLGMGTLTYAALSRVSIFIRVCQWVASRATGLSPRLMDGAFIVAACTYFVVFSALSALKHLSFNTLGFDTGVFDQAIWNSMQGHLYEVSI